MKSRIVLLGGWVGVVLASAQNPPSSQVRIVLDPPAATDKNAPPAKKTAPDTKTAPADKSGSAKKEPAKPGAKKEEPAKIDGMEIARGEKGYLGLQVVDGMFKLSFYDAKKKPVAPDVARAALRWNPKNKIGEERVILNPAEKSLTSERSVKPPYSFKLFISLFKEPAEGTDPVVSESYVVDFRQ